MDRYLSSPHHSQLFAAAVAVPHTAVAVAVAVAAAAGLETE